MRRKPVLQPAPSARVKSLIGARFGRLLVRYYAGSDKNGKALWCCLCDCGAVLRVQGSRLLGTSNKGHGQKSCGCERADPAVRRAARLKVPAKQRKDICAKMGRSVKHRKPAYSMDAHRAAEVLGVSVERVEILAKDGAIGYTYRKGALWVSSGDVAAMVATQARAKKRCTVMDDIMFSTRAI